ncbi:hypothetical protein [Phenylobacterium deserti]|uniref:Uncharacterized protein n=1 Tax=Phenylobacterium deserti TaxID=1914756 RepID=A0A328AE02_9CAUL|nr:hypothetical protein [Phenylobacterium deserti]RAK52717.1 hypothetical protein DJ018_11025 [Phenylobacterium deserti]
MTPAPEAATSDRPAAADADAALVERVHRLQDEVRGLAHEHVHRFEEALRALARLATDLAEGGEAYPPGVREIARRASEECDGWALSVAAIAGRFP